MLFRSLTRVASENQESLITSSFSEFGGDVVGTLKPNVLGGKKKLMQFLRPVCEIKGMNSLTNTKDGKWVLNITDYPSVLLFDLFLFANISTKQTTSMIVPPLIPQ